MSNPLLSDFGTPFEVPPFEDIKVEDYMPAVEQCIDEAKKEIDQITNNSENPTFENTIVALDNAGERLSIVSSVLFNLNSAETSEALQQVAQEASPMLTKFDSDVKQNGKLFERIKSVYSAKEQLGLDDESSMLLEKTYKSFIRSGADLNDTDKKRFQEISISLSKLGLKFGENVLAETNDYELLIEDQKDLKGLPKDVIARAASLAKTKGKEGKWMFNLQAPSYIPFMEYAENRSLREKLFKAYMRKAFKGNDRDNRKLVEEIVQLRSEKAAMLGYETYAAMVLEERMAETPDKVDHFLNDLLEKALPAAREEVEEVKEFMKEEGYEHALERWDWAFFSEKLRKKKFDLDDELIKPYFKLENVIDGVFKTAGRLYGLSFRRNDSIPKYHRDVETYEVLDESGQVTSVFFADFFPRDGKRPGAWMTSFRSQKYHGDKKVIPHISIVCNFTPSSEGNPSLLKFDEVKTLFHEFGHALHGMLADTRYAGLSGTSVYWDFVELPSQIFENWCYEKECLDLFAKHFETGEPLPDEYLERLKTSSTYHEAYATVRQISFGLLDMGYHHRSGEDVKNVDVIGFEKEAFSKTELFPTVEDVNMSVQFAHIFAGGYAAGYYSYKWAEVLDADAFSVFQSKGVFDKATAKSFKDNILSQGGTKHPMELYKAFRGQEPTPEALLRRAGLLN